MDPIELSLVINDPKLGRNKYILGAVAQNPKATAEILQSISTIEDGELHRATVERIDFIDEVVECRTLQGIE